MSYGLNIREEGALDFVSLGALVHRLDPGIIPFRKANAVPDPRQRRRVQCRRQPGGLLPPRRPASRRPWWTTRSAIWWPSACGRWASSRSTSGSSTTESPAPTSRRSTATAATACARPWFSTTVATKPAALLKPGDFDWNAIFAGGVRWFHSGGIFAALSETTAELIIEGMQAAKAAGAVVSFDLNFREKLWKISGGQRSRAVSVIGRIVKNVDVLVGNEEDLQKGLGIPGPGGRRQIQTRSERLLRDDRSRGRAASADQGRRHHASRSALDEPAQLERGGLDQRRDLRRADLRARRSSIASAAETGSPRVSSTVCLPASPRRKRSSWAGRMARLLTTFPGDTTMATVEQVRAFAKGGSARIQR